MVPYLRAANVKDGVLELADVKSMNFTPQEQAIFSLRPGDVLVTEGSGSLTAVGASAVWQGEVDGTVCFQNTLLRLRPRTGTDPRFLEWWARSAFGSGVFASVATGANIYHVSAQRVRALPCQLPSLEEQRRIADYLDAETERLTRMTQKYRAVISKLEERDRTALDSELSALESVNGTCAFRRYVRHIVQGNSPQADGSPADESEWGILKLSSVKRGVFASEENKRLTDIALVDARYEVKTGDLLVTRANTPDLVGDAAVVPPGVRKRLLLPDLIYRIELEERLDAEFACMAIMGSRIRSVIHATARGTSQSMVKLRGEDIRSWQIPVADHVEQKAAVDKVHELRVCSRQLQKKVGHQLNLLEERRRALIAAAVTGQFDVSTAGAGRYG